MIDFSLARRMMVDGQVRTSHVTDAAVIAAMLEVPREVFVAEDQSEIAYLDRTAEFQVGGGTPRFMLRPAALAALLQAAKVAPDAHVLDAGCATGYSSVVLSRMCATVIAVEGEAALAARATELAGRFCGEKVTVVTGPPEQGAAEQGPYDAIIVNGALRSPPSALLAQLRHGGRLAAVMAGDGIGRLTVFTAFHGEVSAEPIADATVPVLEAPSVARPFVF